MIIMVWNEWNQFTVPTSYIWINNIKLSLTNSTRSFSIWSSLFLQVHFMHTYDNYLLFHALVLLSCVSVIYGPRGNLNNTELPFVSRNDTIKYTLSSLKIYNTYLKHLNEKKKKR